MGLGDELLAAGHAQRVYDADPTRKVAICDAQGHVRTHDLWRGNPIIASPAEAQAGHVHRIRNGSNCRPYIQYPFTNQSGWRLNREWKARDHAPRLYLSTEELIYGHEVSVPRPFVLIEPNVCSKSTRNKIWPFQRFASVVNACPELTFLQPLHTDSIPLPGVHHIKTSTFREACALLAGSVGYVGIEGAFHHAARALGKPAVVIVGGAIDWDVLGYPEHIGITGDGPPCGKWMPCDHCRTVMDGITVERVVNAIKTLLYPVKAAVA